MTKISIIMPVYNSYDFLDKSIGSIINQSLPEIELICIDDGSTDESMLKLNSYADKYDFIKVVSQNNQGSGNARNHGIDLSNGEYIGFLDADDVFLDEFALEKMYEFAKENDSNIVSANMRFISQEYIVEDNPHYFLGDYCKFNEYEVIESKDYGIPYAFYKNIFNRNFLNEHNIRFPDYISGEDPIFMANALVLAKHVAVVPLYLYGYNHSNGGGVNLKIDRSDKKKVYIQHFKETIDILENGNLNDSADFYKFHLLKYLVFGANYENDELFEYFGNIFGSNKNLSEKNLLSNNSYNLNINEKIFKKLYNQLMLFKSVFDYINRFNRFDFYYEFEKAFIWFIDHLNMDDLKVLLRIINDYYEPDSRIFKDFNGYIYYKFHNSSNFVELSEFNLVPNKPTISVISRISNWSKYLWSNYHNITDQSYYNFEIIFIYEDSKDNSLKILKDIKKNDYRVTIIDNSTEDNNLGWKKALDIAQGEYIFIHNPKYKYYKDFVTSLYINARLTKSDVLMFKNHSDFNCEYDDLINYDLESIFPDKNFSFFTFSHNDIKEYVMGSILSPWFKFYKKEFLDENEYLYLNLDNSLNYIAFHISSLLLSNTISFLPAEFNFYEFDSFINENVKISDIFDILNEINIFLKQKGFEKDYYNEYNRMVIYLSYRYIGYFNSNNYFNIIKKLLNSLNIDFNQLPFDLFKKYDLIVNSKTFEEFNFKNKFISDSTTSDEYELILSLNKLNLIKKDVIADNHELNDEISEIKKFNKELYSSSSWKLTKPLRKIKMRGHR